jgi:3-vinyl bacteriochlorophyllide hydratase
MPQVAQTVMLERRAASIWTKIHPIFALGQLLAFLVSVGCLVAYFFGAVSFDVVNDSALVKIGLMVGAVLTGSFWEHDIYGFWWFAPDFMAEDVMTLIVFITQMAYLLVGVTHSGDVTAKLAMLGLAYSVYVANVAQYIHKTQRAKAALDAQQLKKAA